MSVYLSYEKIGEYVEAEVLRDGSKRSVDFQLSYSYPRNLVELYLPLDSSKLKYAVISGIVLENLTLNACRELGMHVCDDNIVVIANLLPQGEIYQSQRDIAKPRSVIVSVNSVPVSSIADVYNAIQNRSSSTIALKTGSGDIIICKEEHIEDDNEYLSDAYGQHVVFDLSQVKQADPGPEDDKLREELEQLVKSIEAEEGCTN